MLNSRVPRWDAARTYRERSRKRLEARRSGYVWGDMLAPGRGNAIQIEQPTRERCAAGKSKSSSQRTSSDYTSQYAAAATKGSLK